MLSEPTPLRGFTGPDVPPDDVFSKCVRCGLCLPSCPTYVETRIETSGPRGRIALIKAVSEGTLDLLSPGFVHQMSECLDCRACADVCPSGVEYGRLLEPARAQIVRATRPTAPWTTRLVRTVLVGWLFSHLWLMRAVAGLTRFYQRSGLQRLARRSGLLRALRLHELDALAPPISARFFVPRGQRWRADGPARATAFVHAGCVAHVAFAAWNEATVRVLRRLGCDVVVPADQGCCGAIAVHAGDPGRGRAMAKRTIVSFERSGADVYVINAAGCGSALKEYPDLFHDVDAEWRERAERFSAAVRDVTEFVDELGLAPGLGPLTGVATYQDACHLAHAQRITAPPRRILDAIPGLEVREMPESSLCCGSAGVYNVTMPEMAGRLGRRKAQNVLDVAPQIVATANPGCALQLRTHLAAAARDDVRVAHVIELLDEAYTSGDRLRTAG